MLATSCHWCYKPSWACCVVFLALSEIICDQSECNLAKFWINFFFTYLKGASQLPQAVPSASVQSSGAGPGGGRSNEYFGPAGQATEEPPFQTDGLLCARRDSGGKRCFSDNCYQQSNIQTELITEISHEGLWEVIRMKPKTDFKILSSFRQ